MFSRREIPTKHQWLSGAPTLDAKVPFYTLDLTLHLSFFWFPALWPHEPSSVPSTQELVSVYLTPNISPLSPPSVQRRHLYKCKFFLQKNYFYLIFRISLVFQSYQCQIMFWSSATDRWKEIYCKELAHEVWRLTSPKICKMSWQSETQEIDGGVLVINPTGSRPGKADVLIQV